MKDLPISILDTGELYICTSRIESIAKPVFEQDPYATSLCNNIEEGITGMERAMGRMLKSPFTPITKQKDEVRDDAFIALRDYVSSRSHNKNPVIKSAAIKIAEIISNIGNYIYKLGNAVETTKMKVLITSLSTPEATQWLQIIGGTEDFTVLKDAQMDFEATVGEKVTTESKINIPLLRESTKKIEKYLVPLLIYIETSAELNPDLLKPLEKQINKVITDVVTIARARITREENKKKTKE